MNSLSISKRITLGFSLVLLILVALAAESILQMFRIESQVGAVNRYVIPLAGASTKMLEHVDEYRLNAHVYGVSGTSDSLKATRSALELTKAALSKVQEIVTKHESIAEGQNLTSALEKNLAAYGPIFEKTVTLQSSKQTAVAQFDRVAQDIIARLDDLINGQFAASQKEMLEGKFSETPGRLERIQKVLQAQASFESAWLAGQQSNASNDGKAFRKHFASLQSMPQRLAAIKATQVNPANIERMTQVEKI